MSANVEVPAKLPARPESTYRIQFHKGFTFKDATAITPYLAALGVTHAYASPYLKAAPGSTHGYDVIDHCSLNPELGTTEDYEAWLASLSAHGLSHILDTVPNHVGVATNENNWWNDVLENGRQSAYAEFFDIAWEASPRESLRGKVLLPLLGEPYGETLEKGELRVSYADGAFAVNYYDRRFPLSPATYGHVLPSEPPELLAQLKADRPEMQEYANVTDAIARLRSTRPADELAREELRRDGEFIKQRLRQLTAACEPIRAFVAMCVERINGKPGEPKSFDALDALLTAQNYRLAYWRTASDEINYRRFFDINDLAALRQENPKVLEATHKFTLDLVRAGKVAGLRIDHPDGLYDPLKYLKQLQEPFGGPTGGRPALHVTVEKILAADEPLPDEWPVDGTTGYDFLNKINGLFVDPRGEQPFTKLYEEWTGDATPFADVVYQKKLLILDRSLASELNVLSRLLDDVAQSNRRSRDFTLSGLREGLRQVIACFPIYRTYVADGQVRDSDRPYVDDAVRRAAERNPATSGAVFDFIRDTLLLRYPDGASDAEKAVQQRFVGKFQQLTAPVTAKGIEDTAFYVYQRFSALNEVGGDPDVFGVSPTRVHEYLKDRQSKWPYGLSALSTHDTKRSEDVRARLNVLSEMPTEWAERVRRWLKLNAPLKAGGGPDAAEEYLIYQTIVGAVPLDGDVGGTFVERIQAYLLKAMREAKVNTTWTDPNAAHEEAVKKFIAGILDGRTNAAFVDDFVQFAREVGRLGLLTSLSQTLLRLTAPGVPDTYQGTELWDFSLVDPDNRRPVDYRLREAALKELPVDPPELLAKPNDGRVKLFLTTRALKCRREYPGLFSEGEYVPLVVEGSRADHVFAFVRRHGGREALVVLPRLVRELLPAGEGLGVPASVWGDTRVALPTAVAFRSVLGERVVPAGTSVAVATLLAEFPVGLFVAG